MKLSRILLASFAASLAASALAAGCSGSSHGGGAIGPVDSSTPTNNPAPTPTPTTDGNGGGSGGGLVGGGGGAPGPIVPISATTVSLPSGLEEPVGIASADGKTLFVTARETATGNAVIVSIAVGGDVVKIIATGAPLGTPLAMTNPTALAISRDGTTLFVADISSQFNEAAAGAILSVPTIGGPVRVLSAGVVEAPTGIAVSPDGATLVVTGFDRLDGQGAVFSLPSTGGTPTEITKGGLLSEPTGVNELGGSGTFVVADAGRRTALARVVTVTSGGATAEGATLNDTTEVPSGIVEYQGHVIVVARRGNSAHVSILREQVDSEIEALEGPPLAAPHGIATNGAVLFIADSDATGPGAIVRVDSIPTP